MIRNSETRKYDVIKYSRSGETLETLDYAIKGRDMAESICEMKQRELTSKEIEEGHYWSIPNRASTKPLPPRKRKPPNRRPHRRS